jgi:hypothetical protein
VGIDKRHKQTKRMIEFRRPILQKLNRTFAADSERLAAIGSLNSADIASIIVRIPTAECG